MKIHELKSWPEFYNAIMTGSRRHELRRDDRGFAVGDQLRLREYDPAVREYTGSTLNARITSLTSVGVPCAVSAEGLSEGFCIFTVELID